MRRATKRTLLVIELAVVALVAMAFAARPLARRVLPLLPSPVRSTVQEWRADFTLRRRGLEPRREVTYVVRDGTPLRLDLYLPRDRSRPVPLLVFFHGGGWRGGSKEEATLDALSWAELGVAVANVEYRLAPAHRAPAAVEDARCALLWLASRADSLGLDRARIVTAGRSAGGHLALMAAFARREDGFDGGCASVPDDPRVAAVVNLYGPADLGALLLNSPSAGFTSDWLGTDASGADAVRRLSPASLASPGSPPILTVQGSADDLVPEGATGRFHARLDSLGVRNRLVVLPGAGHTFSPGEEARARDEARRFLASLGLLR